jgi:hypothetical protein
MEKIEKVHIIIVDEATPEQLNAAQELIKTKADGWWHHLPTIWLVGGTTSASEWVRVLKASLAGGRASVIVLALPDDEASRDWAYYGVDSKDRTAWLHKSFA